MSYDAEGHRSEHETDKRLACWLDEAPADAWEEAGTLDALRAADLTFLDALLEQLHQPQRERTAERVARVVATLQDEATTSLPRGEDERPSSARPRRRLLAAAMTLAAALLLSSCVLYWMTAAGRVAEAAVQEAFRSATQETDRQYAVHTRVRTLHGALTEFDAMLYVRGPKHFALHHPGLVGDLWMGGNGTHYWIKPVLGPAQFVDRLQSPLRWAETDTFGLPQLQMTELLSYLVTDYELMYVGDEPAGPGISAMWRHVRGLHRLGSNERPDVVDLWADPSTGVACRLELAWHREPVTAGIEHVTLHLVGEAPQASSWYDADSHGLKVPTLPRSPLLVPTGE
ncbi:MAG: hypothetical protein KF708_19140 [Pirellulales bacterium]|nr:hypothetical protein [Pirellulales bacterium]